MKNLVLALIFIGAFGMGLGCIPIMLFGVVGFVIAFAKYDDIDWGVEYEDY